MRPEASGLVGNGAPVSHPALATALPRFGLKLARSLSEQRGGWSCPLVPGAELCSPILEGALQQEGRSRLLCVRGEEPFKRSARPAPAPDSKRGWDGRQAPQEDSWSWPRPRGVQLGFGSHPPPRAGRPTARLDSPFLRDVPLWIYWRSGACGAPTPSSPRPAATGTSTSSLTLFGDG
ncbi:uncharacterized protein LOC143835417 [Paroedura picta]|uniref:uncharacterized protein LOC143835417 n=1 Tax=Paroedura picta TaxID=143630 RepID=UPI00405680A9